MGGAPESSNQQTEPNVASDAFNFLGPREPVPRAHQMQSKPAQIAAGIYNGAIAPTLDYMASPMGLATTAVPFAGQIPARLTQAAFVPSLAKGAYESGKETQKALNDPQSTTQDIATAASATVGQGAGALMGYKGALESGAGKYLPNKGESGSVGLGSPSSRMKESINAIDEGLEEKPATPLAQYPTSEQGFYSQLQKVLHEKMPNNASVDQIRAIIDPAKGSGVKPDEIKWSNFEGFLEGKKSVTKQEVLDYLRNEGSVKFEEKTSGGSQPLLEKANQAVIEQAKKEGFGDSNDYALMAARGELSEGQLKYMSPQMRPLVDELKSAYEKRNQEHKNGIIQPKYAQYTLPNGENYREVVLTMPKEATEWNGRIQERNGRWLIFNEGAEQHMQSFSTKEEAEQAYNKLKETKITPKNDYTSSHFPNIPNYVAHMRLNERPDSEGNNGLFIEEIQSDRHQAGREKGYQNPERLKEIRQRIHEISKENGVSNVDELLKLEETNPEFKALSEEGKLLNQPNAVPDAPFRKDWHTQLFKRALRDAVDKGHDWIGWTSGDTQAGRYDLSKQVDALKYVKMDDGTYKVQFIPKGRNGEWSSLGNNLKDTDLANNVGKEIADKIAKGEGEKDSFSGSTILRGFDLKVGGEGMKGFYDKMLPNEIGKYVKKWGGKVEEGELDNRQPEDNAYYEEPKPEHFTPIWKVKITPEMRKSIQQGGQPQVSKDTDIFANLV